MPVAPPRKRAVQYVRMSTDHQEFSTVNQKAALAAWAEAHDLTIVGTYEDPGRSGLTLSGRPALRQLIADVLSEVREFDVILVYDVSRWGRFQDADESAHLEFLCRSAGVEVHYCAEPFPNDGSPFSSLFKVMKRTLAAEYSRELSVKVKAGKARLASYGFHQGSVPGFGLERLLIDQHGKVKRKLAYGERKNIATDRVILTPGAKDDVATIRWMYETYLEGQTLRNIRDQLNASGRFNNARPWTIKSVHTVLSSPKYAGEDVWGFTSAQLAGPRTSNPPSDWIVSKSSFEPIVSRDLFDRVLARRRAFARKCPTDDDLLKRIIKLHRSGRPITHRAMLAHKVFPKVLARHFGSVEKALEICGIESMPRHRDKMWWDARSLRCSAIRDELKLSIESDGSSFEWDERRNTAIINGGVRVVLYPLRPRRFRRNNLVGWQFPRDLGAHEILLLDRLDANNAHLDYFVLPPRDDRRSIMLREHNEERLEIFRVEDLSELAAATRMRQMGTPLPHQSADPNPYMLGRRRTRIPRFVERLRQPAENDELAFNVKTNVTAYLARKLRVIDKAAAIWSLSRKMHAAIRDVLNRPEFRKRVMEANASVPVALYNLRDANYSLKSSVIAIAQPRREGDGLLPLTKSLLANAKLCPRSVECLAKMNDTRQLEAAHEMLNEQRWSHELARVLFVLTPPEQILRAHAQPTTAKWYARIARKALEIEPIYRDALKNYRGDALALVALTAYAQGLLQAMSNMRLRRNPKAFTVLQDVTDEVMRWRAERDPNTFTRGRVN